MARNTFTTITTRYAGFCARCQNAVPVGTRVRFGRGKIYHFAAECPAALVDSGDSFDPADSGAAEIRRTAVAARNFVGRRGRTDFLSATPAPLPIHAAADADSRTERAIDHAMSLSDMAARLERRASSGPVEFTESAAGERARANWARRYDGLNGAPESEDDR